MSTITDEKLACVKRELAMRRKVYGRWVAERRMSEATRNHEIACMEAIVADYTALSAQETGPEPDLFSNNAQPKTPNEQTSQDHAIACTHRRRSHDLSRGD